MKKILLLFLLAFSSFLVLAHIDEAGTLISPFLKKDDNSRAINENRNREVAEASLSRYNRLLSEIYRSADPSRVSRLPASGEVRGLLAEEISFLQRRGQTMDIRLKSFNILEINSLTPVTVQIKANEKSELRYLTSGNAPSLPYSEIEYTIVYTLIAGQDGFIVSSFEVAPVVEGK